MISPIKTIVKNLSNSAIRFRVSSRLAVAMAPAGTQGDTAKIVGDIFSLVDGDRSAVYILSMVKDGNIAISYTMDKTFEIGEAEKINMIVPVGDVSAWYNSKCVVAPVQAEKEEPKKAEEQKKAEEPKQEPAKQEELKQVEEQKPAEQPAEPAKEEPKKVEEPKAAEEPKAEEPKKEAPKAGRKIKVQ